MSYLSEYTTEQLETELAERKQVVDELKPLPRDKMNFDEVVEMTVTEVRKRVEAGTHDPQTGYREYLMEVVFQVVYGDDVFEKLDRVCA